MSLNPCKKCGGPVRLSAIRLTVNRKRGVGHSIVHLGLSSCDGTDGFSCAAFKPYPRRQEDREYHKLMARWNEENPQAVAGDAS